MRRHGSVASAAGLGLADHLCWNYGDEGYLDAAVAFLDDGRRAGQRLLYLADRPRDALIDDLAGLEERDALLARGALIVRPLEEAHPGVSPDPEAMLTAYRTATERAIADGYSGLRVVGEATPLVRDPADRAVWARWEHVADRWMGMGNPMAALCAFDRRALGAGAVDEILRMHPLVHRADGELAFHVFGNAGDVVIGGDVDLFGAPDLERALEHTVNGARTVIDLSEIEFIDHHGLLALAHHGQTLARSGARLSLRGASSAIRQAWRVSGLDDIHPMGFV